MPRTQYRNGDDLTLQACGCDGCKPMMIQGVFCHEIGCPEKWRDLERECFRCGFDFLPGSRYQSVCSDCLDDENNYIDHDEENDL